MAINLITGLPGNCKTLYSIAFLREIGKKEPHRPIYYFNVPLTEEGKAELKWIPLEKAEDWYLCPPGAIIVIDECQIIFRNRSINTTPPKFVTELETHRHKGFDLYFITQHPNLIDPAIRRLTQSHKHCIRAFGMQRSVIHEWTQAREDCAKQSAKRESIKHHWKFDKSVYPLYKSAELHTVKKSIPARFWVLLAILFIALPYLAWSFYGSVKSRVTEGAPPPAGAAAPGAAGLQYGTAPGQMVLDPVADAKQYVYQNTPRLEGYQHTAPKYDELTKPQAVPMPAMCVQSGRRCQCYTQQATRMDIEFNQCVQLAQNGYFEEFNPNGHQSRPDPQRAVQVLDAQERLPISGASTRDRPISMGDGTGYGVNGGRHDGVRTPGIASQTATGKQL